MATYIDLSPPAIYLLTVPSRFCCDIYSCFLFILFTSLCSRNLCIWLRLFEWLPCWEKDSHFAIHACCNIVLTFCGGQSFNSEAGYLFHFSLTFKLFSSYLYQLHCLINKELGFKECTFEGRASWKT